MSLDPVLKRHYINVPKPQSRPIPNSQAPPRSQTISHPSLSNSYTCSDLLSLSISPSPLTAHHAPPIPATASRADEVARILAPESACKIENVNQILRKDSVEFLEGLVKQGKLPPTPVDSPSPTTAIPPPSPQSSSPTVGVLRSRTLPIPVPAPVVVKRKNTHFPLSNHPGQAHSQSRNESQEEGGWGEFSSMVVEDGTFDETNGKKEHHHQGVLLDFEIDSTLSPIDIELMSAKRLPSSSPVSIPIPPITKPGGGAGAIFNKSLGSATFGHGHGHVHGHGQYSPASPSPLSLSLAQSISKRHEGLRNLATSSSSPIRSQPSAGPTTAQSPNVQSVTIVSSPIEDLLPWRKASLLSAKPTPIAPTPPVDSAPPTNSISAVRKTIASLNAFAPPFPLPHTTPTPSRTIAPEGIARAESSTLPLPPSLPKKPTGILPPVFVKRELAMLPQTMALPDVPPMGDDWIGERSLSGNEKRRRASEFSTSMTRSTSGWGSGSGLGLGVNLGMEGLSRPGSSLSMTRSASGMSINQATGSGAGGSAPSTRRPQRLVSLGEKLKENINRAV